MTPEQFGAVGDGVTDDTEAFQDMIDAALAQDKHSVFHLRPVTYLLDGAPRVDRKGNSILSLSSGQTQKSTTWIGQGPADLSGRTILRTTRTDQVYSAHHGPPSVIGSATFESLGTVFPWTGLHRFIDLEIDLPVNSALSGIDGWAFGGIVLRDVGVFYGDGNRALATNAHFEAFGFRLPTSYNAGHVLVENCKTWQAYAGIVLAVPDHVQLRGFLAHKCKVAMGFEASPISHVMAGGGYVMNEHCPYGIAGWSPTAGVISLPAGTGAIRIAGLTLDNEGGNDRVYPGSGTAFDLVNEVLDANNILRGELRTFTLGEGYSVGITGAQKLKIIPLDRGTAPPAIASEATLTIPTDRDHVLITGTTAITSITASYPGRIITLQFSVDSTARVTDGGNLLLAGTFTGAAHRALTLRCDGTNWLEMARSTNYGRPIQPPP